MDGDLFKLLTGTGGLGAGALAGVWFYLWLGRGKELVAKDAKIDTLQTKIQDMLQSQLEGEPQRRQTLADITRAIADNTNLLRDRLKA